MSYNNFFLIPVSRKRQTSMRRRFIIFSSILFLLILILGSVSFFILMEKIQYKNAGHELMRIVQIEQLKLESSMNSEIAIALKMADSSFIQRHFINPSDIELQKIAFEEIAGYRRAFTGNNVFWIGDIDKKYYFGDEHIYTLNPAEESSQWYNEIMENPASYSLMVNFDIGIKKIMLWIDAPVLDNNKPVGIVGTGVNLSDFIDIIFRNYRNTAGLYFFNAAGEITGADDVSLVENKVNITEALGKTGEEIFAKVKELKINETRCFWEKDDMQITAIGSLPALNWYVAAVHSFSIGDLLQTGMTALFGVMMIIIFSVFVVFNLFILGMLEPLKRMIKTINQTLSDWELKSHDDNHHNDEIGTLGEFLNMTVIDQLTGIYNRRYMDGYLKMIIKSLARNAGRLSLLMIDIDHFKKYNDTYGHVAGDNCLKTVTAALAQCITRKEDFIARYGGEEFAVVLPNTDKNGAQVIADKLIEKINECKILHEASDVTSHVTISIGGTTGIVNYLHHGSHYIRSADKALYESKRNGRNRYTFKDFEG